MATQNGVNYALQANPTGENQLAPGLWHGRVRCQMDSFVFTGEAAGEIIRIAKLPIGAKVIAVGIVSDGLGGAVTFEIGDENSNTLYATGLASGAGALLIANNENVGNEIDDATKQSILLETADAAATGTIQTFVLYSAD
jgi:hypothetical protein